ncbi:MAG: hypothetical protein K2X27_19325 [Candidatus Obscuribacterales bacterium]|nr:hypothetical protein [Candidatus Obscuribacterales bacterium]
MSDRPNSSDSIEEQSSSPELSVASFAGITKPLETFGQAVGDSAQQLLGKIEEFGKTFSSAAWNSDSNAAEKLDAKQLSKAIPFVGTADYIRSYSKF